MNDKTEITVEELKARLDRGDDILILDVRETREYEVVNIGAYLIPLSELPKRIDELSDGPLHGDPSKEIVVHCKSGHRSQVAAEFLRKNGFKRVKNLIGGIDAWSARIDPSLRRY
jgi:adenylyltransferase/sulfurtransferase